MDSDTPPAACNDPAESGSAKCARFLQHLSPQQVGDLMSRYYAGEPVADLLREYSIGCGIGQLVWSFPLIVLDKSCPHCGVPLVRRRRSRYSRIADSAQCRACGHADESKCRCQNCKAVAAELARAVNEQAELEVKAYCQLMNSRTANQWRAGPLSPVVVIALLSLLRSVRVLEEGRLSTLSNANRPLAPTKELSEELLFMLANLGLILLDPGSPASAFEFQNNQITLPKLLEVGWKTASADILDMIDEVERSALEGGLPADWMQAAMLLHTQLIAAECRSYIDLCLRARGLPIPSTKSVEDLIQNLLMDLSVSEAFCVIWIGVQQADEFKSRTRANPIHAANYAIDASRRWICAARDAGKPIKNFKRPSSLPRSALGYVLHDIILRVGRRGFECHSSTLWPAGTNVCS